jgi:hypothetical protein
VSHHDLQRALVVALHDPGFVAAMHADPAATLAPFGLDDAERAQLLAVDRRAFAIDRLRGRRLMRTLADELKASVALALIESRALALLDGFVGSAEFRAAIAADRSLIPALGDYLTRARADAGRPPDPRFDGVIALELARARARRAVVRPPAPGVGLAPGVVVLASTSAALEALQAVERHLFELGLTPHLALVDDRPPPPSLPEGPGRPLALLFRPPPGPASDVALEAIEPPLFRALDGVDRAAAAAAAVGAPLARDAAVAALGGLGLPVSRPALLLEQLVADGLVVW